MLICIVMDKHGSSWSTVRERVGHSPASLTFCLLQQPVSISLSCILTVWSCCHVTIIQQTWNTRCVVWHFWICCLPLFPCFTPGAENDLRGQTCTTDTAPWTSKTGAAVLVTVCLCFCCNSARAHIHTHTHTDKGLCESACTSACLPKESIQDSPEYKNLQASFLLCLSPFPFC